MICWPIGPVFICVFVQPFEHRTWMHAIIVYGNCFRCICCILLMFWNVDVLTVLIGFLLLFGGVLMLTFVMLWTRGCALCSLFIFCFVCLLLFFALSFVARTCIRICFKLVIATVFLCFDSALRIVACLSWLWP